MAANLPRLTHKGWFLLCPVYVGAVDSDSPLVVERYWWLLWWLNANAKMQNFLIACCVAMDPDYVPAYAIRITGELDDARTD